MSKSCKEIECEPPFGGKEACELLVDGKCTAKEVNHCGDCAHFLGMGDFNLCCTEKSDLVYEDDIACEKYAKREVSNA